MRQTHRKALECCNKRIANKQVNSILDLDNIYLAAGYLAESASDVAFSSKHGIRREKPGSAISREREKEKEKGTEPFYSALFGP